MTQDPDSFTLCKYWFHPKFILIKSVWRQSIPLFNQFVWEPTAALPNEHLLHFTPPYSLYWVSAACFTCSSSRQANMLLSFSWSLQISSSLENEQGKTTTQQRTNTNPRSVFWRLHDSKSEFWKKTILRQTFTLSNLPETFSNYN